MLNDVGKVCFADMFFDFFAAAKTVRFGEIQANVLGLPALLLNPFFDGLFVLNDFHPRFEGVERHAGKALGVELAEADLVIVIIRRAKNGAAHAALGNEGIGALWGIDFGFVRLIKRLEMFFENPAHRFLFGKPNGIIERTNE